MEKILNVQFAALFEGPAQDLDEYFKHYNHFFQAMTYDTVSFEVCITEILPEHGFPADDDAREQLWPVELLQPVHTGLDGLANQGAALLHLPLDGLAVETHLRGQRGRRFCIL